MNNKKKPQKRKHIVIEEQDEKQENTKVIIDSEIKIYKDLLFTSLYFFPQDVLDIMLYYFEYSYLYVEFQSEIYHALITLSNDKFYKMLFIWNPIEKKLFTTKQSISLPFAKFDRLFFSRGTLLKYNSMNEVEIYGIGSEKCVKIVLENRGRFPEEIYMDNIYLYVVFHNSIDLYLLQTKNHKYFLQPNVNVSFLFACDYEDEFFYLYVFEIEQKSLHQIWVYKKQTSNEPSMIEIWCLDPNIKKLGSIRGFYVFHGSIYLIYANQIRIFPSESTSQVQSLKMTEPKYELTGTAAMINNHLYVTVCHFTQGSYHVKICIFS